MLVAGGWDENLAMEMDDTYRKAFCILQGQRTSVTGQTFNFASKKWDTPQKK